MFLRVIGESKSFFTLERNRSNVNGICCSWMSTLLIPAYFLVIGAGDGVQNADYILQ